MSSENEASGKFYYGYVNENGIEWNALDGPQSLTASSESNEPSYYKRLLDDFGTLNMQVIYVNRKAFKWLRWLQGYGYTRLDFIWAYRCERKGHPRCR